MKSLAQTVLSFVLLAFAGAGVVTGVTGCAVVQRNTVAPVAPSTSVESKQQKPVQSFDNMEFALIKGGCFQMGDDSGSAPDNQKPRHEVCLSDYYLGKYEVTQGQWEEVMGSNPSSYVACGKTCPVDGVTYEMALNYIEVINKKTGKHYRLPTEAEWEFAAKDGINNERWAGTSNEAQLGEYVWYEKNSEYKPHPVGLKKPNKNGLYDMSGNIMEWCQDWYGEKYYSISPKTNPAGPLSGKERVMRGGAFGYSADLVMTTARSRDKVNVQDGTSGLRLAMPVNP